MFNAINQMGFDTTADDLPPSTTLQPLPPGSSEGKFRFMKITHYYLTGSAAELVMKRVSGSEMWVSTARLEKIFLRKHTWRMWRGVGSFPLKAATQPDSSPLWDDAIPLTAGVRYALFKDSS